MTVAWEPPGDDIDASVMGYEVWYVRSDYLSGEGSWVMSGGLLGDDVRGWLVEGLVDFEEYPWWSRPLPRRAVGCFPDRCMRFLAVAGWIAAPTNIGVVAEGGSVTVGWDAPEAEEGRPPPTGYHIRYREAANDPGSEPNLAWPHFGFNVRQGAVQDLVNNTWYEFRVAPLRVAEDGVLARPGKTRQRCACPGCRWM